MCFGRAECSFHSSGAPEGGLHHHRYELSVWDCLAACEDGDVEVPQQSEFQMGDTRRWAFSTKRWHSQCLESVNWVKQYVHTIDFFVKFQLAWTTAECEMCSAGWSSLYTMPEICSYHNWCEETLEPAIIVSSLWSFQLDDGSDLVNPNIKGAGLFPKNKYLWYVGKNWFQFILIHSSNI